MVRSGVGRYGVRAVGEVGRTSRSEMSVVVIKNADEAAFGCHIDTSSAGVVGQHVGRFAGVVESPATEVTAYVPSLNAVTACAFLAP